MTESISTKGHKIRIVLSCLLFFAAIVDVGVGFYSVSKHNAHAANYWDRENMYDGPWMPLEFILLGAAVVVKKWDEPDGHREQGCCMCGVRQFGGCEFAAVD